MLNLKLSCFQTCIIIITLTEKVMNLKTQIIQLQCMCVVLFLSDFHAHQWINTYDFSDILLAAL